jgi:hypothetical protein
MRAACREVFPFARDVVPICAEPRTRGGQVLIPRHGLAALRKASLALLPDALRRPTRKAWPDADA